MHCVIRAKTANHAPLCAWFNDHGNADDPNSCVLKITLASGTIIDNDNKYGEWKYEVDFIKKEAK